MTNIISSGGFSVSTHKLSDKIGKKIKKFFLLYEGPYRVNALKVKANAYELVNKDTNRRIGVYSVTQLKK